MKYILIISTLFLIACNQELEGSNDQVEEGVFLTADQQNQAGIQTAQLKQMDIPQRISVRGIVDVPPTHRASISVFHGGYVRYFDLLPGKRVRKGDLLFTLQNPEYISMQQAYLEVKEQIAFLEADYNRQKALVADAISSEKKFRQAESDYLVAKAKQESLKEQLELINIDIAQLEEGEIVNSVRVYAPISGFVSDLSINKGAYLSPQDVAMQIVNTEHMHLELKVYERDVTKLKEGQRIEFKVNESDSLLYGEVHLIEKVIDSKDRSVMVHGHIPDSYSQLVVGAYIEAWITTGIYKGYAVSAGAIVDMDGMQYVAVKDSRGGKDLFQKIEVQTGQRNGDLVEVIDVSKLIEKEIVVKGAYEAIK